MRIAICEDLTGDARALAEALARYLEANNLTAQVDHFTGGEEFISAFTPGKYQIIFMDIYMKKGGLTGMDAAEKATAADPDAAVIFVTTSEDHGIAAYNFAVYYIVKPVRDDNLAKAMTKCRAQIERYAKTIEVIVDRQPVKLRLRNIFSVESLGRACVFSTADSEITASSMIMDGLVEKLGGFPFIQCHRSYVVNLLHVKDMRGKSFLLENGRSVPIGRAHQDASGKAFKEYFWNRIQGDTV